MRYEFHTDKPIKHCDECNLMGHEYNMCLLDPNFLQRHCKPPTIRTLANARPKNCPLKEFADRQKPFHIKREPRPPFDPNFIKRDDCTPGTRVITNTNSTNWSAGLKGTITDEQPPAACGSGDDVTVLFDAVGYFEGKKEIWRTVYMYRSSLSRLEE